MKTISAHNAELTGKVELPPTQRPSMTTIVLIKWLTDARDEYKRKRDTYDPQSNWWFWYDGKVELCNSLITLLRSA